MKLALPGPLLPVDQGFFLMDWGAFTNPRYQFLMAGKRAEHGNVPIMKDFSIYECPIPV
jgi:hypothetical protein